MNVATTSRTALTRSFPLVLLLASAALACKDDAVAAGAPPLTKEGRTDRAVIESAGDVVIAPTGVYTVTAVGNPGSVTGTVTLSAPLPIQPPVSTGADSALCGASVLDESLVQQGTGLGSVVVWLDDIRSGKPLPTERRIELESERCRLLPRVQAAVVGSAVNVLGHDVFRQHLRWMSGGEQSPRAEILLSRNEQVIPTGLPAKAPGMVVVRDVNHPWPRAFLAVFDHPYFAVTKPDGSFAIDGVPPGSYTLHAWHERTKVAKEKVTVSAGGAGRVEVRLEGR